MNNKKLTEPEVRAIRNRVFCQEITDHEWERCKGHWTSPSGTAWLIAHDFPLSESLQRKQDAERSASARRSVAKSC